MSQHQTYQRRTVTADNRPAAAAARCARSERCSSATVTDSQDPIPAWADLPSPFCRKDTSRICRVLAEMPRRYVSLRLAIGQKPRLGEDSRVTGSRDAPIPVRLDIDALIRDMLLILVSWEERVADTADLTRPSAALSRRRRDEVAVPAAVRTLAPRIDILFTLPGAPMMRVKPIPSREKVVDWAAALTGTGVTGSVHPAAGYVVADIQLGGSDAGLEILNLGDRCRRALRETTPPPMLLDGIPCRRCEHLSLIAAPEPEWKSECSECGDLLSLAEYGEHARRYAIWAKTAVSEGRIEPSRPAEYAKLTAA
jgi:hypothetical protein